MKVDQMTTAHARLAMHEAAREFLFDPNVNLIDFGYPSHGGQLAEDELTIRIHVRKKLSGFALEAAVQAGHTRPIPRSIGEFKTDVPEGTYRPHWWGWWRGWQRKPSNPRASRAEVMRGGISISDENRYSYGTLGGIVFDRTTGRKMILSNWHVLVGRWSSRPGQRIYQPGRRDGGTSADTVATYTRDAMSLNLDAAVATVNGKRQLINDQFGLKPVTGAARAELGMEVVKSGRKSGITYGRVTAIEGIVKMHYNYVERIMRNIITIEPRQPYEMVSAGGDSGSWWLDRNTMRAVGLHFAGSDAPERALAHDMRSVLEGLEVIIVNEN